MDVVYVDYVEVIICELLWNQELVQEAVRGATDLQLF
jgi:hypothetical protein